MVNGKWRMDWQRCIELNTEEALFVGQKWSFLTISTTAKSVSGETITIDRLRTHLLFLANSVESLRNSHQLPEYGPHPIVYVVGAVVGAFVPTVAFVSRLYWWKNRIGSPVICKQNTLYHQSSSFLSTSYQFICVVFLRGLVFFDKNMVIKSLGLI